MTVLVVGGAKSGKSSLGEKITKQIENAKGKTYYIATMKPSDSEDLKRIENHIKDREGLNFITIEKPSNLEEISKLLCENDTLLIDNLTSVVTNEMFKKDKFNSKVKTKIYNEICSLSKITKNIVIVSDYLFSDSIVYDDYTENFRKELGSLNIMLGKISDIVIESSFSNIICYKGKEILKEIL